MTSVGRVDEEDGLTTRSSSFRRVLQLIRRLTSVYHKIKFRFFTAHWEQSNGSFRIQSVSTIYPA